MACSANQNFATRRLLKDFKEIQNNQIPTVNVSCAPLENDLFTWHGNLVAPQGTQYAGGIFHFELAFPESYPIDPPSIRLFSHIDHPNVFGNDLCLDMLAPSAGAKMAGWNPAYSILSILIQLQAFLFEERQLSVSKKEQERQLADIKQEVKTANQYECQICGHRGKLNAYPPFRDEKNVQLSEFVPTKSPVELFEESLVCFHSKLNYKESALGLGLKIERIARTGDIHYCNPSPALLSLKAFNKLGVRKSFNGEQIDYWLPLHLTKADADRTLHLARHALSFIKTNNTERFDIEMVESVLIKVISTIIIKTVDLKNHASCLTIQMLVFAHSLLLLFVRAYPELVVSFEAKIKLFIEDPESRIKDKVPNLLNILIYLMATDKYTFADVNEAFNAEKLDRQIFWILLKIPELGKQDSFIINDSMEEVAFKSQSVSYCLAIVSKQYLDSIKKHYKTWMEFLDFLETNFCKLPDALENSLQKQFKDAIDSVDSFGKYFDIIGLPMKNREQLAEAFKTAIANSKAKKYHGCQEELTAVPSHPAQISALNERQTTLLSYLKEGKIEPSSEETWKERCCARWMHVNRYSKENVVTDNTPALVAALIDANPSTKNTKEVDFLDIKTFYDQRFKVSKVLAKPEVAPYPVDFSWKQLYIKLDIEESLLLLNYSEDVAGLYAALDVAGEDVHALTLYLTSVEGLKSKYHYVTKCISKLTSLKRLSLVCNQLTITPTKLLLSLQKGLTNFNAANGKLESIHFNSVLIGLSNDDNFYLSQIYDQLGTVKELVFRNSNMPSAKEGNLLASFIIKTTTLIDLAFHNSLLNDKVLQQIADSFMRNKKIQAVTMRDSALVSAAICNVVYNLAFSSSLRHLDISNFVIQKPDAFIENLQKFLSINSSVESLVLEHHSAVASSISFDFCRALAASTSIKTLSFNSDAASVKLAAAKAGLLGHAVALNGQRGGCLAGLHLAGILDHFSLGSFVASLHYTNVMVDQWFGTQLQSAANSVIDVVDTEKKLRCDLRRLDLSKNAIQSEFRLAAWNKLKDNALDRRNKSMPAFLKLFIVADKLEELGLSKCLLDSHAIEGIKFVFDNGFYEADTHLKAPTTTSIKLLDLSFNPLKKEGIKVLTSLNGRLDSINTLDVNHCSIGVAGAAAIFSTSALPNLQRLNLFANMIDVDGARSLARFLGKPHKLEVLDIGYNRIKNEGLSQIGQALESHKSSIRYLNLRYNFLTFQAFEKFLDRVKDSNLKVVLAKNNEIEDYYLKTVADKVSEIKSLEYLDILDKTRYFEGSRPARTVWFPMADSSNLKDSVKRLLEDKNSVILSVSQRQSKRYPGKTGRGTCTFVELGHANSAAAAVKKSQKKKLQQKAAVVKARLAGTATFRVDKRALARKSQTSFQKARPTGARIVAPVRGRGGVVRVRDRGDIARSIVNDVNQRRQIDQRDRDRRFDRHLDRRRRSRSRSRRDSSSSLSPPRRGL